MAHLQAKQEYGEESEPGVERVEVGDGGVGQIVGVEHCLEAHSHEDEGEDMHECVQDLDHHLLVIPEHSIDQHGCNSTREWHG